jgi:dihydropteroate synthase
MRAGVFAHRPFFIAVRVAAELDQSIHQSDPLTTSKSQFPTPQLQCGRFVLSFERPLVMGILNVTPDSFSDGGRFLARDDAIRRAEEMLADGAELIDIGGESTRPGAVPVALDEELARVIPIVEALRQLNVPLSVDTYKPAVMRAALDAGADMINDIWGFRQPGALDAVRDSNRRRCRQTSRCIATSSRMCAPSSTNA